MDPKLVYYAIQLLEGLGMGSFFPIYTPWLEEHGLNFYKMGVVNFFYHIVSSILDPFTGYLADKFGKRKMFIIGQMFWTSTQFIYGLSSRIPGFLLAEGIAAVGNSLKTDALESWLQNKVGEKESSRVMGRSKILFTVGQITTSIIAGYMSVKYGKQVAWLASGICFLVATMLGSIALFLGGTDIQVTGSGNEEAIGLKEIITTTLSNRKIRNTALLVISYNFATKPMFMYWPQIVQSLNMVEKERGWTILAIALPAILGSYLAGENRLITRDDRGFLVSFVILALGLSLAGIAGSLPMLMLGLVLVEIPYGAVKIVTYGHIYNEVDPRHRSTVNSIISAARTLGGAVSLLVMGKIADLFSPQVALIIGGVAITLAILVQTKKERVS